MMLPDALIRSWETAATTARALGTVAAVATVPGTLELALVTLGGWMTASDPGRPVIAPVRRLAVLVPAHDEAATIECCIASLLACRADGFIAEVVVLADNCSDTTAALARSAGARVLERFDNDRRGKGHALQYAFSMLSAEQFDAFVIVDADTSAMANLLTSIVRRLEAGADAVQVPYGVRNPDASPRTRLMNLALLAFNRLRPRGRAGLGLSAGILGNGFAVSRATLEALPWNASSVVEDLEYHLRLVTAGRRVAYAEDTEVLADMPVGERAAGQQRVRWEGGRLRMIAEHVPALLREISRGRLRLIEPLLELLLLPLAMHSLLVLLCLATPDAGIRVYALTALAICAAHVMTAALRCGRGWADLAALASVPRYLLWKLALLPATVRGARRTTAWVRTEREDLKGVAR